MAAGPQGGEGAHGAGHDHHHEADHGHDHATLDHEIATNRTAIRAVWVSAIGLGLTAAFQLVIVGLSGSVALLSDALHNIGDVLGTLTLWIAFRLSRRPASETFPFGWRRSEDLGGLLIVLLIAASAGLAGYESIRSLVDGGRPVSSIPLAIIAALVGVVGNEGVARYKIRIGRRIDSPALIADGQHARTDSLASAGAAVGLGGVALGVPWADPVAGLAITALIVWILIDVGRDVLLRLADGVRPGVLSGMTLAAAAVEGVVEAHDVRARHAGRALLVSLHVAVDPDLSLRDAHAIGEQVRAAIVASTPGVSSVEVHLDPAGEDSAAHALMDRQHPDVGGR